MTYSKPPADRTRPHKAMVVDEFSPATWDQWIRLTSRADDGRDPVGGSDRVLGTQCERAANDD